MNQGPFPPPAFRRDRWVRALPSSPKRPAYSPSRLATLYTGGFGDVVQSGGTKKVSGTGSAVQAVGTKRVPASPLNPEQEEFLQDVYPTLTTEQIQNKALYQKAWDDFLEAKEDARREDEWGEEREKLAEKEKDKVLFKAACPSKLWTDDVLRNRAWVNWQADKRLGAERKVDQMFRSEEDRQYRVEDPIPAMTDMMLKRHQANRDGHRRPLMDVRGFGGGFGMGRERAVRTGLRTTATSVQTSNTILGAWMASSGKTDCGRGLSAGQDGRLHQESQDLSPFLSHVLSQLRLTIHDCFPRDLDLSNTLP